jgi:hypothetical protein
MRCRSTLSIFATVLMASLAACICTLAGRGANAGEGDDAREQSWNREQVSPKKDARTIIQQKAQVRAEQRQERMATASWYGLSYSRPSGSSTPFTSRYGSLWEMPVGRPYYWYPAYSRPNSAIYWR